ncbi:exonuclease domain-containing protein [Corynebacterium frankenforstense]
MTSTQTGDAEGATDRSAARTGNGGSQSGQGGQGSQSSQGSQGNRGGQSAQGNHSGQGDSADAKSGGNGRSRNRRRRRRRGSRRRGGTGRNNQQARHEGGQAGEQQNGGRNDSAQNGTETNGRGRTDSEAQRADGRGDSGNDGQDANGSHGQNAQNGRSGDRDRNGEHGRSRKSGRRRGGRSRRRSNRNNPHRGTANQNDADNANGGNDADNNNGSRHRGDDRHDARDRRGGNHSGNHGGNQNDRDRSREQRPAPQPDEERPWVVVTLQGTGIHPATSRVVAVDAVVFDAEGEPVEKFHEVIDPGERTDPGPVHQHGLTHEEIRAGRRFSQVLKKLDRLIDNRTLIVHDAPLAWGWLVSESRRAMNAAARANRSRRRGRSGSRGRRKKVGHVPRPLAIVDTLAAAHRAGTDIVDARPGAVARAMGLDAPRADATVARARRTEADTSREQTMIVARMARHLAGNGGVGRKYTPEELRADKLGLQRSHERVDAAEAPRPVPNPGVYTPERGLEPGMEIVVTDEITREPDEIIDALMRAGLAYTEKLTRQSSAVVCNRTEDLRGKAMHAHRKNIPILTDEEFLAAVARAEGAQTQPVAAGAGVGKQGGESDAAADDEAGAGAD